MIREIDPQFKIDDYNIKFIDDSLYSELADSNVCIIRINELDYEWEQASKIALYKDELRINCNLDRLVNRVSTVSQKDGISIEQLKLLLHVMNENKELQIYISSTNINNIQRYLFNIEVQ